MNRVYNRDFLSVMNEDTLRSTVTSYKNAIEASRRRGADTHELEVEYCYLWSELELRDQRRAAHEDYLRSNPQMTNQDDDYFTDEGDYDSSLYS
jgi:hypothetical protein